MTITTPMKIVVAVFAIAMIGLLFYLFDWQAKYNELSSYSSQLTELEAKRDQHRELVKDLPVLTKRKADLEQELSQVVQSNLVPEAPEMFVANYIAEIEKLTREEQERCGDPTFEIVSITPGVLTQQTAGAEGEEAAAEATDEAAAGAEAPDALKQFPTRMFQMSMRGRYGTLVDFLRQLGDLRLERLVTINKIALSPASGSETGGSPTLTITIPITAYMRQGG